MEYAQDRRSAEEENLLLKLKWAEAQARRTYALPYQMALIGEIARDDAFETAYIRVGELGAPGYVYAEKSNSNTLDKLASMGRAEEGAGICSVTWGGIWRQGATPYINGLSMRGVAVVIRRVLTAAGDWDTQIVLADEMAWDKDPKLRDEVEAALLEYVMSLELNLS